MCISLWFEEVTLTQGVCLKWTTTSGVLLQVKLPTCNRQPLDVTSDPAFTTSSRGARKEGLGSIGITFHSWCFPSAFTPFSCWVRTCCFSVLWSSRYPSPVCKSTWLNLQRAAWSKSSYAPSLPISEFTNWNIKLNNKPHLLMWLHLVMKACNEGLPK